MHYFKNQWIPFHELQVKQVIGIGSFSKVYRGNWLNTEVAIKEYYFPNDQQQKQLQIQIEKKDESLQSSQSSEQGYSSPFQQEQEEKEAQNLLKYFLNQLTALVKLRHPNIILFLGISRCESKIYVVTEYIQNGSLSNVLLNQAKYQLSITNKLKIALDIARGVHFLHNQTPKIFHRDLKSDNILITQNYQAKLCDFGQDFHTLSPNLTFNRTAKLKKSSSTHQTNTLGTIQWMAPQFVAQKIFTQKSDVYSYGVLLWEILHRKQPFQQLQGIQIAYGVVNTQLRPSYYQTNAFKSSDAEEDDISHECASKLNNLIEQCWQTDPDLRPQFSTIIQELNEIAVYFK